MRDEPTEDQIQDIIRRARVRPPARAVPASGEPVDMYLRAVREEATMSPTEEQRTLALSAGGDEAAENRLVQALLAFAAEIAMQVRPQTMEPLDAILEANLALIATIQERPSGDLRAAIRRAIEQSLGSDQSE